MTANRLLPALAAILLTSTAPAFAAPVFNRIASFPVAQNNAEAKATSAEIIVASEDGNMLVYSDSPAGGIGFIDITDPAAPQAAGWLDLDGEPTSVTIVGNKAYVGVNTSESKTNPSGRLAIVDLTTKAVDSTCDLPGQPDSTAHNDAGTLLAVAIENERDEDLYDGDLPQLPAGSLVIAPVANSTVDCAAMNTVDLTGIAVIAGEDPEPEFVDFNSDDEIAVTLQENNHIIIVDGKTGAVESDFTAGTVTIEGVDTKDDGALSFTGTMTDVAREPDAVQWLDTDHLVIANEGDWKGGSRSFTVFNRDGSVAYESNAALEMEAVRLGHYPDGRNKKGVEPEGLEVATIDGKQYIFVAEERSSLIAVYDNSGNEPKYIQSLPSGISPEGLIAIPQRKLLATANEADLREDGLVGSYVMLYQLVDAEQAYPQIVSDHDADGKPIGWVALSGLAADPEQAGKLYAVSDSFLSAQPSIYTIDATAKPAHITTRTVVTRNGNPAQKLDLEGIAVDGEGGFWLANEGRSDNLVPHALFHVDAEGEITEEIPFPAELLQNEIRFGAEGITAVGSGDDLTLWVAIQREWGDDPKGEVKLLAYKPVTKEWSAVRYPLETTEDGWVGLSEITAHGDFLYLIERDNQSADKAKLKALYRVKLADLKPTALDGELPVVKKELVRDLIPDLKSGNGYVLEKVEGFTVDASGTGYVVTDNDGVDDSSGETMFWSVGAID